MEKNWKNYYLSVVALSLLHFLNSMGTCGAEQSPRQSSCTKKCTSKYSSTMTQVNCSFCQCQSIPYNVIPFNVTEIDMTGNHLTVLTENCFRRFSRLSSIILTKNRISKIEEGAFNGLSGLKTLKLSSNPLKSFANDFLSKLKSLITLRLDNIPMTCSFFNTSIFRPKIGLTALYISHNKLNMFPKFLYKLSSLTPTLTSLFFNDNNLSYLGPGYFRGIETLQYLHLSNNRINYIQAKSFKYLLQLRKLVLTRNPLGRVSSKTYLPKSLHTLSMADSDRFVLNDKSQVLFENLPELRSLNLRNNHFNFRRTNVSRLFFAFENLTELNLQGTRFKNSEMMHFKHLKSMTTLILTKNQIKELDRDDFSSMVGTLKQLQLGSNRITTINVTSLPNEIWTHLEKIELSNNPWNCDCEIIWLKNWLKTNEKKVMLYGMKHFVCSFNEVSKGKSLLNLTLTQEECFTTSLDYCLASTILISLALLSITSMSAVLHRYRWHVKYWYFVLKVK